MPIGGRGRQLVTTLRVAGQAAYNASMGAAAGSTASVGTSAQKSSVDVAVMGKAEQAAAVAGQEYAASQGSAAVATQGVAAAAGQAQMILMAYAAALTAYAAGLAAIGAAAWSATKGANEFEQALTDIDTQAGYTEAQMQQLADRILAANSALTPGEWTDAMKPFAFAGYEAEQAWQAAEAAARAAEAYAVDTKDTSNALLKTMKAFGIETEYAAYAMDVLAQSAAAGTMEMPELARFIPRVASAAGQAGASLEEMAASLSAISFFAGTAREATGGLRTLYRSLAMAGYDAQISQEGLLSVLRTVMKQTGGNRQALQELLGSAEAVDAILKLATDDFGELEKAMNGMGGAAGTVNDALAGRQDSMQNSLDIVAQNLEQVHIKIGEVIKLQEGPWIEAIKAVTRAMSDYFSLVIEGLEKEKEQAETTREDQVRLAKDLIDHLYNLGKVTIAFARIMSLLSIQFSINAAQIMALALGVAELRLAWLQLKKAFGRPVTLGATQAAKGRVDELKDTIGWLWETGRKMGPGASIWGELTSGLEEFRDYAKENIPDIFDEMEDPAKDVLKPPDTKAAEESEAADNAERLAHAIDLQSEYQKDLAVQADVLASQTDDDIRKAQIRNKEAQYMLESEEALLDLMRVQGAEYQKIADQRRAVVDAQASQNDAERKLQELVKDRQSDMVKQSHERRMAVHGIAIAEAQVAGNLQQEIRAHQELLKYLKERAEQIKKTADDPRLYEEALKAVASEQEKINRLQGKGQRDMVDGAERLKNEVNEIYNAYQKVIGMDLGANVAEEIERLTARTREFRRSDYMDQQRITGATRQNVRTIRLRIEGGSESQADSVGETVIRALEGSSQRGGGYPRK